MSEQMIPVLNEHQSHKEGQEGPANGAYEPTPEEKADIKLVNQLYEKAKKGRKPHDQKWADRYRFYRGKQWKEQRPSYRHSEVVNMVFSSIQSQVPIQLDSKPRIEFLPQNPQDTEISGILNQVVESDWTRHNWFMDLTEIVYDANIYGTGIGYMGFDPDADFGVGAIEFCSKDPFYCFPDPRATNINKKSRYWIEAEPEDIDALKTKYPEMAKFFKPDLQDLLGGNKEDMDQVQYKSPTDTRLRVDGESSYQTQDSMKCLKLTAYIKSDEYLEECKETKNEATGEVDKVYIQKKKYPNGRKIVIAGGVRCEAGPNPYDDGLFPYVRYQNYILGREFWGMSEIEQLEGPQKTFNKLLSFALDVYALMGNPIWVVDTSAGVDTDNLVNRTGLIVEKEPGSEVRREQGVEISATLLALTDRMRNWFNETAGSSDISRTVNENDISSGVAIQSLQDVVQTRIRQKSRNLDACLQDAGQLYISRVFQFYSSPKIIRITDDQNAQKYFQFHVKTQNDESGNPMLTEAGDPVRVAHVAPFGQNEAGQAVQGETKQYVIQGNFDVKVSTGSSLPFAKTERSNLALTLFKMGAIDRMEVLKNVEFPNWEAVAQRMDQMDQQKMAQAQQMEMAKRGGGLPAA